MLSATRCLEVGAIPLLAFLVETSFASPLAAQDEATEGAVLGEPMAYPVEATPWRLTDHRWLDQTRPVGPEVVATTIFADGAVRANGGCNRISGNYELEDDRVRVGSVSVGTRSCAEQTMHVERAVILGLERAAQHRIEAGETAWQVTLVLADEFGNEMLRYRVDDPTTLPAADWLLERYTLEGAVVDASTDPRAILSFDAERASGSTGHINGSTIGSSGCNGIVADFYQHGSVLSFGPIERTGAPCRAAIGDQEDALVAVMDATSLKVDLQPGRLVLTSSDSGERLEFVSASPFEGSTWLLARLPGAGLPRTAMILRLTDGIADGIGECDDFEARYETNGVLIRFHTVPAVPTDCDGSAIERRFRAALRRTRFADLTTPSLRFIDARGRTVARFRDPGGP